MNARQIEIFRAVMRDGSLTAAAHSLAISQPAVSKAVHQLERQIGYKLFERIGGRLTPTAEAELLFRDADRVFRELEILGELARNIGDRKGGLLRIGVSLSVMFTVLPQALAAFRKRHPDVTLELHTLPKKEITEQLLVGGLDLGVTMSTIQAPTIRSEILATTAVVVVMPESDPLASLEVVTAHDLVDRTLISFPSRSDLGPALDDAFARIGAVRSQSIQVSSSCSAAPLIQAGLGIALVDGFVPWHQFGGMLARPFQPAVLMNFAVSTNAARPMSRFFHDIRDDIRCALDASKKKTNVHSGWTVIEQLV
jgi:DNA-binding transcriptional LysR family regulator